MYSNEDSYSKDPSRSRAKLKKENFNSRTQHLNVEEDSIQELKQENNKLKKLLKQAQAKRVQITKQCSQLSKTIQKLQMQNQDLRHRVRQQQDKIDGNKYRWEELKFINKQISSELQQLRAENESLNQKLRYSSDVLQRKYEELEEKTRKRMEQCIKRVKKSIHYLQSLSAKNIDKTREDLIQNLRKSIEVLRGKYNQQLNCEGEIQELMNPLKTMQEEIIQKTKQLNQYKQENMRLVEDIAKYKQMQRQQIPMFKQAIQKLKKNLVQVRSQLSENEYQKLQLKKKYQQRLKQSDYKYNELFKECRKIKLQKKIYENKLEELEADVEEEKERLLGQNQLLKKLYQNNNEMSSSRLSQTSNFKMTANLGLDKKTQEKRGMKKQYSTNQIKTSNIHLKNSSYQEQQSRNEKVQISDYNEQSSMFSQQNLKKEICRIDQQIMQIQKTLNKELQAYH